MKDLSILIPSRNEEFITRTVEDILEHVEADTEVIVLLDGQWPQIPLPQHPRLNVIYCPESIGQRAGTNLAYELSQGRYIMKVDAHCSFDQGFDRKMLEIVQPDWTVVPAMRNLHAFNWVCKCGFEHYQDKGDKCPQCHGPMEKKMIWKPRRGTWNHSYAFDSTPHFQYFSEYTRRPEQQGLALTETMSLQGSCFMLSREKYKELNICDDQLFGSWGSQGIEVAVKTWLSGGKVMVNHKTWYAHMFRTKQENGFGFPYQLPSGQTENAKQKAKELFFNNKWDKAIHPLSWLVKKFWPIKSGDKIWWTEEDLNKLEQLENYD